MMIVLLLMSVLALSLAADQCGVKCGDFSPLPSISAGNYQISKHPLTRFPVLFSIKGNSWTQVVCGPNCDKYTTETGFTTAALFSKCGTLSWSLMSLPGGIFSMINPNSFSIENIRSPRGQKLEPVAIGTFAENAAILFRSGDSATVALFNRAMSTITFKANVTSNERFEIIGADDVTLNLQNNLPSFLVRVGDSVFFASCQKSDCGGDKANVVKVYDGQNLQPGSISLTFASDLAVISILEENKPTTLLTCYDKACQRKIQENFGNPGQSSTVGTNSFGHYVATATDQNTLEVVFSTNPSRIFSVDLPQSDSYIVQALPGNGGTSVVVTSTTAGVNTVSAYTFCGPYTTRVLDRYVSPGNTIKVKGAGFCNNINTCYITSNSSVINTNGRYISTTDFECQIPNSAPLGIYSVGVGNSQFDLARMTLYPPVTPPFHR